MNAFTGLGIALLVSVLAGCSVADGGDPAVAVAWDVPLDASFTAPRTSPTTDGERFFAVTGGGVLALAADDGREVWRAPRVPGAPPTISAVQGGRLFVGSDVAVALDAATGRELWRTAVPSSVDFAEPGADDNAFYAVGDDDRVYAFDAATGAIRWTADIGSLRFDGIPRGVTSDGRMVYAAIEHRDRQASARALGLVVALDAATGREQWRYTNGDGTTARDVAGSPVVAGDLVLIADNAGHAFVGIDRATGRERWRVTTTPGFAGPDQALAVSDGIGYGTSPDERVYAVDLSTGRTVWVAHPDDTGSGTYHAVCGSVVLSNHFQVVATARADGRVLDNDVYRAGSARLLQFAVAGRRAFFLTETRAVALDCP